jgi:hypothetical protein
MNEVFQSMVDEFFDKLRNEIGEPLTAHEYEFLVSYFKLQAQRHLVGYEGM